MNFIPRSFLSRIAFQLLISDYDTHFLFTNSRKNIGRCKTSLSLPILGKTINDKNALYNGRRKDSEEKNEFLLYYLWINTSISQLAIKQNKNSQTLDLKLWPYFDLTKSNLI